MPWSIQRDDRCPVTKPFAVVLERNGSIEGCHPTRAKARAQQAALYASEKKGILVNGQPTLPEQEKAVWAERRHPRDRRGRFAHGTGTELPARQDESWTARPASTLNEWRQAIENLGPGQDVDLHSPSHTWVVSDIRGGYVVSTGGPGTGVRPAHVHVSSSMEAARAVSTYVAEYEREHERARTAAEARLDAPTEEAGRIPPGPVALPGTPHRPFADSLKRPKRGKLRKIVDESLPAIDSQLDLPKITPRLSLVATSGRATKGSMRFGKDDGHVVPKQMKISTFNPEPHLTFAHESGHLVDAEVLGTKADIDGRTRNVYGSFNAANRAALRERPYAYTDLEPEILRMAREQDHQPEWDAWYQAVRDSPEYKELALPDPLEAGVAQYLLTPMELFARAFAQWVATRSNDPTFGDELDAARDPERIAADLQKLMPGSFEATMASLGNVPATLRYRQWSNESFAPIAGTLDKLMEAYDVRR